MASSSAQHAVAINELLASTEKKLQKLPSLSNERCIYSAPIQMRLSCEQHFTPRIVSIGPIHHGNEKLNENEHLKERYLAEFCELTKLSLEKCYEPILQHEIRLRNCYADVIGLESKNFLEMILVDAAFLLMILVYNSNGCLVKDTDLLFKNPEMILDIRHDMLLLENQLPFFILDKLYKKSKLQSILYRKFDETFVTIAALEFINNYHSLKVSEQHFCFKPKHILDLYRSYLIPANWNWHRVNTTKLPTTPTTKELYQAGMKIEGCKTNICDITCKDGILKIPQLIIDDFTEQLFRNLLAYELCHYPKTHIFSDYCEMMRRLALSSEDIKLLAEHKVIINRLPNAESVSTLFQNITTGNIVDFSVFHYSDVIYGLDDYYKNEWHKWKAILRDKYFKAPWVICSVSAVVLLLVLAIVQTVLTILQFVLPK